MEPDYIKESLKIQEFLDDMLQRKESNVVEFKSAKGGFPRSFWETYSSFANTDGGVVIFGVKEKNGVFSVDPLSSQTVADFKKKFYDLQHDREKVSVPLLSDKDIVAEEYGDGYILAFFIPGTLLISIPQYYEGGHSECRNPSLQKMFGLIGRSDKAGSGVDKILEGWKFAKWRRPFVSEKSHPDFVELYMPLESLFSEKTIGDLKAAFGDFVTNLPHNELIILALALTEGEVTNSSLRNLVDLHPSDLTKLLRKLCKENFIISSGFGRGTTYKLNKKHVASSDVASSDVASSSTANQPFKSKHQANVASSDVASSDVASFDEENVMIMVREYCKHKWLSAKDISLKIGRHPTHTRRVIKKMVISGVLEQEFPNQPTHPAQRYRLKK